MACVFLLVFHGCCTLGRNQATPLILFSSLNFAVANDNGEPKHPLLDTPLCLVQELLTPYLLAPQLAFLLMNRIKKVTYLKHAKHRNHKGQCQTLNLQVDTGSVWFLLRPRKTCCQVCRYYSRNTTHQTG